MQRVTGAPSALFLCVALFHASAWAQDEPDIDLTGDPVAEPAEASPEATTDPAGDDDAERDPLENRFVHTHNLQLRVNPLGVSLLSDMAYRVHLFDSDSMLLQGTRIDFGISTRLSPAFAWGGPYIEATPVAFLKFRVAFRPMIYFGNFGFIFDGFESRDAIWDQDALDQIKDDDLAASAFGLQLETGATLQLRLGPVVALYENRYTFYWMDVDGDFYYEPLEDFLLAGDDAIWTMTGTLGYLIGAEPANWFLLVAARYERHRSTESDHLRQQVGGMLLWKIPRDWMTWGEPRVALLVLNYLDHAMRDGGMYGALQFTVTF